MEKANKGNKVVEILIKCTRYCLDCFERVIRFLTKNAYIQIAISGKNFCAAAKRAFGLIMANSMRFGAVAMIGTVFNILGMLFIATANALVVYAAIAYIDTWKGKTSGWIAPCIIGFLEGLVIATMFMGMFSFSSDTILMCFLVDEDEKRPGDARPAIMN